jgi:transcriptional regulator
MYVPGPFAADDEAAAAIIAANPFAVLVTHDAEGFHATHMPFLFDRERGVLAGHMARANPQPARTDGEAMVVFSGPHAYVSPNWYPTKAVNGRAVPTWNYEAVHVYGRLTWREDEAWKRAHLTALSATFEAGQERPWRLDEAPEDYLQRLFAGLVGVELAIERIEAKPKLSHNHRHVNRAGVVVALVATGYAGAAAVAGLMRQLGSPPSRG